MLDGTVEKTPNVLEILLHARNMIDGQGIRQTLSPELLAGLDALIKKAYLWVDENRLLQELKQCIEVERIKIEQLSVAAFSDPSLIQRMQALEQLINQYTRISEKLTDKPGGRRAESRRVKLLGRPRKA